MSTMVEGVPVALETEVVAKAQRRRFTAAEKLRVLRQADGCAKPGEVSALLRREGLYSSHLASWRAARQRGELAGLAPRARGPKAKRERRARVLAEAFAKNPERFPNGCPVPRLLPTAVWINPPKTSPAIGEVENTLTPESRTTTIVDPDASCEADSKVEPLKHPNATIEDSCTAVAQ